MPTRSTSIGYGVLALAVVIVAGVSVNRVVQQTDRPDVDGAGRKNHYVVEVQCTATGGVVSYNTCIAANPSTTTGSIRTFEVQVKTAPTDGATSVDCGVVGDSTATGTDLLDNYTLARGVKPANITTSSVLWGPDQYVKCGSLAGTGANLDAVIHIETDDVHL